MSNPRISFKFNGVRRSSSVGYKMKLCFWNNRQMTDLLLMQLAMYKYVLTRKIKVFDTWTLFHAFYCSASSGWIKVLSFDACIESVASFCHLQNPLRTSPRSIRCAWNSRIWHFHLNNTLLPWSHVCFWRVKTKKTTVKSGHPWHRSSIRVKLFYLCQFRRFLGSSDPGWDPSIFIADRSCRSDRHDDSMGNALQKEVEIVLGTHHVSCRILPKLLLVCSHQMKFLFVDTVSSMDAAQ